ncbi:MAG: hypothetical protein Q9170_004638 [Blastenia crenularia]
MSSGLWQHKPVQSSVTLSPCCKLQESFLRFPPTPPDLFDTSDKATDDESIRLALHVLETERDALVNLHELYLVDRVAQGSFNQAVNCIAKGAPRGGRVVVTGVGKSGKIGLKFVATMNSFGIRSFFLHPTEAMHGDLGMIGPHDTLVILTYSGKTQEILSMLPSLPAELPMIAVTSWKDSSSCPLFAHRPAGSCILLPAPIPCSELDTFGVPAPTSSTTTALALTDALALALAQRLHPDLLQVFHKYHPGGTIGANAIRKDPQLIGDLAIKVENILLIEPRQSQVESTVLDAILAAAKSVSGWVRPSPETIIAPRQIQSIGRLSDLDRMIRLLDDGSVVEKGDWISVEAASTVQEARNWILHMRQVGRGKNFLKKGTILGIVDSLQSVSGVMEIEDIMSDEELCL